MNDKKTNGTNNRQSPVLDFLSGHGSNPIAKNKRHTSNQLETTFINDVMEDIAGQDRANENRSPPSIADDLMAVMRLISDNHEMIQLIQSQKFDSVSELAIALGRELSNVSRTLSRMVAYGLIGYEEAERDARTKKPVWLLSTLTNHEDLDWVQAYCIAMALQNNTATPILGNSHFLKIENVVRDAVAALTEKINLIRAPATSR